MISINGMRFYAHHGCFDQERAIGTHFMVDLQIDADTTRAERSDSIGDTVNYLEVYQVVKREMGQPSQLLEHVAGRIARAVIGEFQGVEAVKVTLVKENPPMGASCKGAGVEVEVISDK